MPELLIGIAVGAVVALLVLLAVLRPGRGNERALQETLSAHRMEASEQARALREEVREALKATTDNLVQAVGQLRTSQKEQLDSLHQVLSGRMKELVDSNEKRLVQIQETVSEKLQSTLEQRLGESFKQVSERLEKVHQGLGDMQKLASGVGDLKKVLTNVKNRGTWGEIQLGSILEQILTAEQYAANVETVPGSGKRVEFAIRLPGRGEGDDQPLWLPVDAKFPQEDYLRLTDAADRGDAPAVREAVKALEVSIRGMARDIHDKYVGPPHTTDFAVMFLPTEGLYAEVLRIPGLVEELQRQFRVVPAGPTTFSALLNSLRLGFQTLAIEKRSSEVWAVLGAVKSEFKKFGKILEKVQGHLKNASSALEKTETRTRVMQRKLKEVQELPPGTSGKLLDLPDLDSLESDDAGDDDLPADEE